MPSSTKSRVGYQPHAAKRQQAPAHLRLERNRRTFGFVFFLVVQVRDGFPADCFLHSLANTACSRIASEPESERQGSGRTSWLQGLMLFFMPFQAGDWRLPGQLSEYNPSFARREIGFIAGQAREGTGRVFDVFATRIIQNNLTV